ncbi:MAG: acetate--CoA ligase family protein [Deltaproteobacteria bacterium]|nr:acetate--CoA ligase family protein [Deltaproteobacteria bacterium]MBW2402036.1 acetate--CoA ligase family protein [Deltaproteobacteria bacterium]MBW2667050.1 acetate--CoA ligase family protein [Deltaproteobacteria bacterium]
MRFYEHESKTLFAKHGMPLGKSGLARSTEEAHGIAAEIGQPVVLKSQVLSGGRMKAGAVKFADTPDEAAALFDEILPIVVNGQHAESVLVEEKSPIAQEYYVGVTWDGRRKLPVVIFSDMGGIDIEEVAETHPDHVSKTHFSTLFPVTPRVAKEAIGATGVSGSDLNRLTPIVHELIQVFLKYDLTLAEINPLVRLEDGRFVVLDGHVDMEAEARGSHEALLEELGIQPEETRQARPPTDFEIAGAKVDASDHRGVAGNVVGFDGDLGLVIGAGGGSLTLFDAVRKHGGKPANYCEIGGNPSVKKTCELTKLVLGKPGVEKIAVMMNVVSNTRVDIVARGVIKGCVESGRDPADTIAIFRIPGAWEDEGFKILKKYGVEFCDRSVSMYQAAGRAVAKMQAS